MRRLASMNRRNPKGGGGITPCRLLMLMPSRERGGAEEYGIAIARGAVAAGWEVHIGMPDDAALGTIREDVRGIGAHVAPMRMASVDPVGTLAAVRTIAGEVRSVQSALAAMRPDVVLISLPTPDASPASLLACRLAGVPALVVFHVVHPGLDLGRGRRVLYRLVSGAHPPWVAVSDITRRGVGPLFGVDPERIAVIHNGVCLARFEEPTTNSGAVEIRAELGVDPATRLVLTVGRLSPQKGWDVLLAAAQELLRRRGDVVFAWAGHGPDEARFRSDLARRCLHGRVHLLGPRRDVPRLLAGADLFVMPSRFEGNPFALMEALAAETPVLASEAAAGEVIPGDEYGLLFRSEDSGHLAGQLAWALDHLDEMNERAKAGHRLVRVRFNHERMVTETLARLARLRS